MQNLAKSECNGEIHLCNQSHEENDCMEECQSCIDNCDSCQLDLSYGACEKTLFQNHLKINSPRNKSNIRKLEDGLQKESEMEVLSKLVPTPLFNTQELNPEAE